MKKILIIGSIVFAVGCRMESGPRPPTQPVALKTFESCGELAEFLEERVGSPSDWIADAAPADAGDEAEASEEAGTSEESPAAAPTVEEADIVKQEGNRLYVVSGGGDLVVYDVSEPSQPRRVGEIDLNLQPQEIYTEDSRVVVIGKVNIPIVCVMAPCPYGFDEKLVVLDVSNPASPLTLKEWSFSHGNYANSRKVGSSVYLVLQGWMAPPDLERQLVPYDPCDSVYVPEDLDDGGYYSFSSWEIVGIDLNDLGGEPARVTVVGSYDSEITATPAHLYLTNLFYEADETGIYLFDLDPTAAGITPRASASVPGRIVDQFSMDETDGVFRIATTTNRSTFGAADNRNYLTTFQANDGSLTPLGQIDSITPGESITAARFLGRRAFVTTYVTKDPLVSVDLSDPASPKVLGELEVPGYASYLHPWGDLLISIGSTEEFWGEVILSLFDVSNLREQKLVEQITLDGTCDSEAQTEHRAFSFFEERGVLAIPAATAEGSRLLLFTVDAQNGFTSFGTIDHDDLVQGEEGYSPTLRRSLEIGGSLYSISEAGMKAHPLDNPEETSFSEMFPGFEPTYNGHGGGCYYWDWEDVVF